MPARTVKRKTPPTESTPTPPVSSASEASPRSSMFQQGLVAWDQFARDTGATATEFLRRFSEEQRRAYGSWMRALNESSQPSTHAPTRREEVRSRLEEWNRRTEEIDRSLREAILASAQPQRDLMDLWVRSLFPSRPASPGTSRQEDRPKAEAPTVPSTGPSEPALPSAQGRRWIERHL